MLVLTRRIGESIVITVGGEKVTVHVRNINTSQVKLGIDAPRHVEIVRSELLTLENKTQTVQPVQTTESLPRDTKAWDLST